ncbi:flagellar assembly protein FliH [Robertmurraya korlensis]|uniref:flagellar assembly protein FliH n=1 Tax=Robertmurraya korlensis TaxID=519977 RepID=UPI000825DB43|nr:flagellar assembly protein FliH [Robertmurraya korlensis]
MSRLIKSTWVPQEFTNENKVISIKAIKNQTDETEEESSLVSYQERERILAAAQIEANRIVQEAHEFAAQIREQIEQERQSFQLELQAMAQQAQTAGFNQGHDEGKQQGYNEAHVIIEQAKETVALSKYDYEKKVESSERTILSLSLKVAEKIIANTLTGDSEQFLPIVKKALKEAREYREIQLHVHPTHYEFLLIQKEDLLRIFPKETELYIFPDSELTDQSCIIESANGRIDASVDQQLDEIKRKLYELLESE